MSMITFSEDAFDEYIYWQTTDKATLKKINKLLKSVQRTHFQGEGKPEPLKGGSLWSRRINEKDRLVYLVEKDGITVVQCKGHYDDK